MSWGLACQQAIERRSLMILIMSCGPTQFSGTLAERWAGFLGRRFGTEAAAAAALGVHWNTADLWWRGVSEPRGRHLARAMRMYPDDIPFLLGEP